MRGLIVGVGCSRGLYPRSARWQQTRFIHTPFSRRNVVGEFGVVDARWLALNPVHVAISSKVSHRERSPASRTSARLNEINIIG